MSLFRTFLFVPGSNYKWFNKLPTYKTDNIILDLEDSVPSDLKEKARTDVANSIEYMNEQNQNVYVRINKELNEFNRLDLEAVITPNLKGLVLPKVEGPEDINKISNQLLEIEEEKNLEFGSIKLIPILETARSMYFAYEVASKDRVIAIAGLAARGGDVQRAVNYQWTPQGLETLYLRSKVVLAARAAGVVPIGGLWQNVHDIEGLKHNTILNRQLGFDGEMVLHPSNVAVVNEIYSPSEEAIAYYKDMIKVFEDSKIKGKGSIMYKGNHIDDAHIKTAKDILSYASQTNNEY